MLKFPPKRILASLIATALLSLGAGAQSLPRQIRLVVGFPAGTAPDIAARITAQALQDELKVPLAVENVPGAGGLIAAQQAARGATDGSLIFLNTVSDMSIAPHMYSRLAYKPNDFVLISHLMYSDMIFTVPNKVPAKDLKEYVAWAREQQPLFMATFGPGSPAHFGTAIFGNAFDIKPEPVHFKATGDAMTAVMVGDVPGLFVTSSLGTPYVQSGKLKALAVTSPKRMAELPNVPTFAELGYPKAEFASWFGLAAPPKTPVALAEQISTAAQKIMHAPEVRKKLEANGFRVTGTTREEFARIARNEDAAWGEAVRATGFKAN